MTIYDTLLTTVTDTLIINSTLSLPVPNNENTILIYPNPANEFINLDFTGIHQSVTITLLDNALKELYTQTVKTINNTSIPLL